MSYLCINLIKSRFDGLNSLIRSPFLPSPVRTSPKYFTVRNETSGEPFPRNSTSGRDKNKLAEVKPWLSAVIYGHAVDLLVDSQVIHQNAKTCVAVVLSHLRLLSAQVRTARDLKMFHSLFLQSHLVAICWYETW